MKVIDSLQHRVLTKIYRHFAFHLFKTYRDDMFEVLINLKYNGYYPKTIIDVGAYKGDWTKEVLKIYDKSDYYLFEPQNDKRPYLETLRTNNPNINFFNVLLGANKGSLVKFYKMETGSSVYSENTSHDREILEMQLNTIDDIFKNIVIDKCLLKLDVQGYEIEVLKGATSIMNKVDIVLLEVSVLEYNLNAPEFFDVVNYMNEIGFIVYDICGLKRTSIEHKLMQCDIFFCKKNSDIRNVSNF